jgi:2-amino-4-hydroxy-6-hydroxymethyldihydropteridine diphosphokinase
MERVYLLLGGNLGERGQLLAEMRKEIEGSIGQLEISSALYESEPWGFDHPSKFLNQVVVCKTKLDPLEVLEQIHHIEMLLGRVRHGAGYAARTADIDILFYGSKVMDTPTLTIPHPRLHERRFTLLPLAEICSEYIHPTKKSSILELLECCTDMSTVVKFKE